MKKAFAVALTGVAGTMSHSSPIDVTYDCRPSIFGESRTWAPANFDSLTSGSTSRTGFFVGTNEAEALEEISLPLFVSSAPTGMQTQDHWMDETAQVVEVLGILAFSPSDDKIVEQLMRKRLGAMKSQKLGG